MRLKTILLFGIIALIASAPMLFKDHGQTGQAGDSDPWQQTATNQPWQPYSPTGQIGQTANSPPKKEGFLSRIFGGGKKSDAAKSSGNANGSPFKFAGSHSDPVSTIGNNTSTAPPGMMGNASFAEPVYYAFANLGEFLRYDISPTWVKSRWPRVSTFPGEDNLTAMRVALVSGPRPVDIHGSLTYFFDNRQRVQRIGFKGWTGNASELAGFVQQAGFTRRNTNGAALFTSTSWGKIKGALRLDHPPVSSRDLPNEQLMVLFELTNPDGKLGVSQQTQAILDAMEKR